MLAKTHYSSDWIKFEYVFDVQSLITMLCQTRLIPRMSLVEQELLTLSEHMSSPPVFSGVRVTRFLVLYVCFVDRCLSFCIHSG
jgi:hypothetical protein